MSPEQQFWWNWWVNFGVAIGTLLAVVVALFKEQLQARFLPPRLRLKLLRKEGEKTQLKTESGQVVDDVRYYHLQVWNKRRRSPADQVKVYLVRIDEPGPSGKLQQVWVGNVPIRWRDQEFLPPFQTVGAAKDCDFFMVRKKEKALTLMPQFAPNNLKVVREGKCRFAAWLQIRSNEVDSAVMSIEVSWDGLWEDGDAEMLKHLEVGEPKPENRD